MSAGEGGEPAPLRAQLLGAPQLFVQGREPLPLERHDAALLALLAIEGAMPRARAAALLWADAPAERARSNLRQRLFKLRRAAPQFEVVADGALLSLAAHLQHDLGPIGPRLQQDPAACAGELLGELDYGRCPGLEEWVAAARSQWRNRRVQALAEIAATLEVEQRIAAALPYAQRLVADDPTLEHAHRRLMRLHYLRGDRAAAMAASTRCRELLALHAGAAPGRETMELARLIERSGELPTQGARRAPLPLLRPTRLVGREGQWRAIDEAMAQHRLGVLLGEAGIGKSRLMSDWLQTASGLASGARPGDAQVPHSLTTRWLRALVDRWSLAPALPPHAIAELARLLPELGPRAEGPWDNGRVQRAVRAVLAAAAQAGCAVIALDDLHYGDEASLQLLLPLWPRDPAHPGWLLAARLHELPPIARAWIEEASPQALAVVKVEPLNEQAVRELLASLDIDALEVSAWAGPVHAHTGGNPLFILETLRSLWAGGWTGSGEPPALPAPQLVAQLIQRRLAQLSDAARDLARVAAVAGQDFDAELATRVLARPPLALVDAWRELESAQVLRDGGFGHDLIRDAALQSIPEDLARLLHGEVARHLQASARSPARIAGHWEAAGEAEQAGRAFMDAAREAKALNAMANSAGLLRHAGDAFERAGQPRLAFAARDQRAHWLDALKRFPEMAAQVEQLRATAVTPRERMLAMMREGIHRQGDRPDADALALLDQARTLALALGDEGREAAAELTWRLAFTMAFNGQIERSLQLAREFMAGVEGDPQEMLWRREYANLLEFSARYEEGLAQVERAIALARAAGERRRLSECLITRSVFHSSMGDLAAAARGCEQARELLMAVDGRNQPTIYDRQLAGHRREAGRFAEALALVLPAFEWMRASGNTFWAQMCQLELARCYTLLGQPGRAGQALGEFAPATASMRFALVMSRARIAMAVGRPALALVEEARALAPQTERPVVHAWIIAIEGSPLREPAAALELVEPALAEARARAMRGWVRALRLRRIEGLVRAGRAGEGADDARLLARELAEQGAFWLPVPEYWWGLHRAFEAAGDLPAASAALGAGRDWIVQTALPNVPAEFRESFMQRNPLHRELLAAANRLLA